MKERPMDKQRNLPGGLSSYNKREGCNEGADSARSRAGYEALSDSDLLGLISIGTRQALESLYDRYGNAVYSLSMYILRDAGAAEEVTQDAFLNVWRRATTYSSQRGEVKAWLLSIAHHRAIDELRQRRRHEQGQTHNEFDLENHPSDESDDPVKYATREFQRGRVREALLTLGPEQREVVLLAYYGGFTHTEIAKLLGHPLGTVKTRMRLALKKLRLDLTPQFEDLT